MLLCKYRGIDKSPNISIGRSVEEALRLFKEFGNEDATYDDVEFIDIPPETEVQRFKLVLTKLLLKPKADGELAGQLPPRVVGT